MTTPIVILGGGMSSLVTAFELTSLPDWKDRYTITIYQQGWRLGGKGASGRNAAASERNEEHGLHLLFGCYENAFRILRRCYEEVVRGPGALPWRVEDAFKPHHTITMYEERRSEWLPWELEFPSADGIPGEGPPLALSPLTYLKLLVRWARQHAERLAAEVGAHDLTQAAVFHELSPEVHAGKPVRQSELDDRLPVLVAEACTQAHRQPPGSVFERLFQRPLSALL